MKIRALLSVLLIGAVTLVNSIINKAAPVISGRAAVSQLEDSNMSYAVSQAGMVFDGAGIGIGLVLLMLLAIWWRPVCNYFRDAPASAMLAMALLAATPAMAYYDTVDNPEFVQIMPNETAFAIPEIGDNKSSQAAFMSEAYLNEKKIAMKRFQIPHTLIKTCITCRDYYVPSVKLLVVNRAPATREWRAGARGTSAQDQSFSMETADSIGVSFGVVFAANVREEDAAKFAYNFGAKEVSGKRSAEAGASDSDMKAIYASVVFGRSLADVVDDNVRHDVQAALADAVGRRDTATVIKEKDKVIAEALKAVQSKYSPLGVSITTLGLATQLSFDNPDIQKAIDENFIFAQKAKSSEQVAKYLDIEKKRIEIKNAELLGAATAKAVEKSSVQVNGGLPSWLVLPESVANAMAGWLQPKK